ncbi:MAG: hypothetical protein F4015_03635 [Acidimicrobiia bacterium]|nr:hypothetical protein [Acidimicrobiia bacterium]
MSQEEFDPSQQPGVYVRMRNQAPAWLSGSLLLLPVSAACGWLAFERVTAPGGLSAGNAVAAAAAAAVAAVFLFVWTVWVVSDEQRRRSAWPRPPRETETLDERVIYAVYDFFKIRRLKRDMRRRGIDW